MLVRIIPPLLALLLVACAGTPAQPSPTGSAPVAPSTPSAPPASSVPSAASATADSPEPEPVAPDMCRLVTAADVIRITGRPATVTEETVDGHCSYNVGDPASILPDYVLDFRLDDFFNDDLGAIKEAWPGDDVDGVGDAAYWAPGVSVLWFTRGGRTYAVQLVLFGDDDGDPLQVARDIALAALARI